MYEVINTILWLFIAFGSVAIIAWLALTIFIAAFIYMIVRGR